MTVLRILMCSLKASITHFQKITETLKRNMRIYGGPMILCKKNMEVSH